MTKLNFAVLLAVAASIATVPALGQSENHPRLARPWTNAVAPTLKCVRSPPCRALIKEDLAQLAIRVRKRSSEILADAIERIQKLIEEPTKKIEDPRAALDALLRLERRLKAKGHVTPEIERDIALIKRTLSG